MSTPNCPRNNYTMLLVYIHKHQSFKGLRIEHYSKIAIQLFPQKDCSSCAWPYEGQEHHRACSVIDGCS
uniref:Uncharacterized protein n=1 Tax=Arundo donax TaxID=35708 RepID=A0A0A9E1Q0_ARUDO